MLTYFGNTICLNNASSDQVNVTHIVSKDTLVFDKAFNLTVGQENGTLPPQLSISTEPSANGGVTGDGGVWTGTSSFTATEFKPTQTPTFISADSQTRGTLLVTTDGAKTSILATANLITESRGVSSLPLPLSGSLPHPVTEGIKFKVQ